MSDVNQDAANAPMPVIKKMRWPFPIIWIVPLAAACLAGWYIYQHHKETGIEITIAFTDAAGIREGQTPVDYRGVTLGHVRNLTLSDDRKSAIAHIELATTAAFVTKADSVFWLVKPQVSLENITGLNTIVSGPYIECQPGAGKETNSFVAIDGPPQIEGPGVLLILSADRIEKLSVNAPVNFRGIQVGKVKDIRLASTGNAVNVTVFIEKRYTNLVRTNTRFWLVKGADISGSLFGGLKFQLGSVQSLLTGAISFATPEEDYGEFVTSGDTFVLHEQPQPDWLKWHAIIELPDMGTPPKKPQTPSPGKVALPQLKPE